MRPDQLASQFDGILGNGHGDDSLVRELETLIPLYVQTMGGDVLSCEHGVIEGRQNAEAEFRLEVTVSATVGGVMKVIGIFDRNGNLLEGGSNGKGEKTPERGVVPESADGKGVILSPLPKDGISAPPQDEPEALLTIEAEAVNSYDHDIDYRERLILNPGEFLARGRKGKLQHEHVRLLCQRNDLQFTETTARVAQIYRSLENRLPRPDSVLHYLGWTKGTSITQCDLEICYALFPNQKPKNWKPKGAIFPEQKSSKPKQESKKLIESFSMSELYEALQTSINLSTDLWRAIQANQIKGTHEGVLGIDVVKSESVTIQIRTPKGLGQLVYAWNSNGQGPTVIQPTEQGEESIKEGISLGEDVEAVISFLWENSPNFYDYESISNAVDLEDLTVGRFRSVIGDTALMSQFFSEWKGYYDGLYTIIEHPYEDNTYALVLVSKRDEILKGLESVEDDDHLGQLKRHLITTPDKPLPTDIWEMIRNGFLEGDSEIFIAPNPGTNVMISLNGVRFYYDWNSGGANPRINSGVVETAPPKKPEIKFGDFKQALDASVDLPESVWGALRAGSIEGTDQITIEVEEGGSVIVTVHNPSPTQERIIITYAWDSGGRNPQIQDIKKKKAPRKLPAKQPPASGRTISDSGEGIDSVALSSSTAKNYVSLDQFESMMLDSVDMTPSKLRDAVRDRLRQFWGKLRGAVGEGSICYTEHFHRDPASFSNLVDRLLKESSDEETYPVLLAIRNFVWLRVCNIFFQGRFQDHITGALADKPNEDDANFVGRMIGRTISWDQSSWHKETDQFLESLKLIDRTNGLEAIGSDVI